MDIELSSQEVARRKRKPLYVVLLVAGILLLAILLLRWALKPSLKRSSFTTAVVQRGNIENTLTATGQMLPEFEEVITSPINASIQKVILDAGSEVKAGQSILTLDKSAMETQYAKLKFQLESKRDNITKLKLELNKSFYDITANNNIKQLRINSLEAAVDNARKLFQAGGGTREDIEQAQLNLKVAVLEKQQLENDISTKQKTMQVEIRESEIEASIQENDLNELGRKLRLAEIVASRPGVVTWVNKNIGASIREGESLTRIADLSSFKVTGSISDNYSDQLQNGMHAIVRINDTQFRGTVVNIYPAVQNGVVSFDVQLTDRSSKLYRPNMKVDVFLITAMHNGVMCVANGPAFKGMPVQDIFVVSNGMATRRTVHIGMTNFEQVEIQDNVRSGDIIITSDMSMYKNVKEITLNQ